MKLLFLILLLTPLLAPCQRNDSREIDSASYYTKELSKLLRQSWDSLQHAERITVLRNKYIRIIQKRNNYTGLALYGDIAHSDYSNFNKILAQDGFPSLNPISGRMGIGISHKRQHLRWDIYLLTFGFNNTTTKNTKKIRTSFNNAFQLDFGIDVLHAERVSLYPYGGISLRFSELTYDSSGQSNPNYTSLSNMRTDYNKSTLESTRLGYQYGGGFDYAFAYNREKTFKFILFIKAGVNKPFKTDIYKADGIPAYKPQIKQGDWVTTIGIIFGNKL